MLPENLSPLTYHLVHPYNSMSAHAILLVSSYRRVTGRDLLPPGGSGAATPDEIVDALWNAPFAVVSHGVEEDPIFNYGNRTALELFEMDWKRFTSLPSRFSAEPVAREERARLLAAVTERGFIDDYAGIRISATGRRFAIVATVWNVVDEDGVYRGQAATFAPPRREG